MNYEELTDLEKRLNSYLSDYDSATVHQMKPIGKSRDKKIPQGKLDGIYELELRKISVGKFRQTLIAATGECFVTEVRNTGTYICGAHRELWDNIPEIKEKHCPHVDLMLTNFEDSLASAISELRNDDSYVDLTPKSAGNYLPGNFGTPVLPISEENTVAGTDPKEVSSINSSSTTVGLTNERN